MEKRKVPTVPVPEGFKIVQRHPRLMVKYHGFLIERFTSGSGPKGYPRYQVLGPTGHPDEYRPIGVSYRYRREAAKFIDDFVNGVAYKDGTAVRDPRRS
jgi:hypothetical protein